MQKREREPWTVCRPCLGPLIALSHPATIPNAELDPDFFYTVNILAGRVGITLQDIYSGQPGRLSWVRDSALQLLEGTIVVPNSTRQNATFGAHPRKRKRKSRKAPAGSSSGAPETPKLTAAEAKSALMGITDTGPPPPCAPWG